MKNLEKPEEFKLAIQGGMLEALGINMYTTLGKCLVEFVANAYDSNAPKVEIEIPFDEIELQRQALKEADKQAKKAARQAASAQVKDAKSASSPTIADESSSAEGVNEEDGSALTLALPDVSLYKKTLSEDAVIVIRDFGHGMSPSDVAQKFLPINRHRRLDGSGRESNLHSEGGRRAVMGRKGLGKLAGFGIADQVIVKTKRSGDSFFTIFTLDASRLAHAENLGEIAIPATYEDDENIDSSGTTITLKGLKPDAVRSSLDKIKSTLAEAFYGIEAADFLIKLNGGQIEVPAIDYDFIFPQDATTSEDGLVDDYVHIPDVGTLPIKYAIRFRHPGQHLSAGKRGARIYCNKRLAAGPSLFKLGTGMHNFHAQDYLECIVIADTLDQLGIDFVNTNRTQLREDNDVVEAILSHVSNLMKAGLAAHSKHRESKVDAEIKANDEGKRMNRIIENLPKRSRAPASKLLRTIALRHGTESLEFKELAPLVVNSVNAGEVLIRLIELQTDPQTVHQIAGELLDLADIERSDALKLYRGRRSGIISLRKLIEKGEELWRKKGIESELHQLFKDEPWLIKPEYSKYLTSDQDLNKLASKLAKVLNVDKFAPLLTEDGANDKDRPDLVFLMSDTASPHVVTIVEFKSPSIALNSNHLQQLKSYMRRVEEFVDTELHQKVSVHGYLIGAMPDPETKASAERDLLYAIQKEWDNKVPWEVLGLEHLLQRAQAIHSDAINVFEKEEEADVDSVVQSAPVAATLLD